MAGGARALVTGEMGIGNTTASAAVIAALLGRPAVEVTGRGTGVDDAGLARKVAVVERALARHAEALGTDRRRLLPPSPPWAAWSSPPSPASSSAARRPGCRWSSTA